MNQPYKILAVDDEKFNLLLLKSCLKGENCTLVTCSDPLEAIGEFKKNEFDVILLDIMLGSVDGFEVRKLIREYNPKIPIIFLTSLLDDINSTLITRIADDQFCYYLNKSFDKNTLLEKIRHAVEVYREGNEMARYYKQLEADLTLAWEVQRVMLPRWCNANDDMKISFFYEPYSKVSGDIFEMLRLNDGRYLVFIGDISGHGIQAALYMSAIQSFIKTLYSEKYERPLLPHDILNRINEFFREDLNGENYMTCLVCLFDFRRNHLVFQSAGHPGLVCCLPDEARAFEIEAGDKGSIPIGWSSKFVYSASDNVEFDFADNAIFIGYTDGLTDLRNGNDETLGLEAMLELLGPMCAESNILAVPFRLRSALEQIGYIVAEDDVSALVIQKNLPDDNQITRIIAPATHEVSQVVHVLADFTQNRTGDEYLATKVELFLSEFLNNITIHGHANRKSTRAGIAIHVKVEPEKIRISVFDRGRKWDDAPAQLGREASKMLEALNDVRATSGRGLAIIRTIADTIQRKYYRGLNETEFTIKRQPAKAKELS